MVQHQWIAGDGDAGTRGLDEQPSLNEVVDDARLEKPSHVTYSLRVDRSIDLPFVSEDATDGVKESEALPIELLGIEFGHYPPFIPGSARLGSSRPLTPSGHNLLPR